MRCVTSRGVIGDMFPIILLLTLVRAQELDTSMNTTSTSDKPSSDITPVGAQELIHRKYQNVTTTLATTTTTTAVHSELVIGASVGGFVLLFWVCLLGMVILIRRRNRDQCEEDLRIDQNPVYGLYHFEEPSEIRDYNYAYGEWEYGDPVAEFRDENTNYEEDNNSTYSFTT